MTNVPPPADSPDFIKVHCYGAIEHYRQPVCGSKQPYERCVSRMEFRSVDAAHRCKRCAATKWARFL